MVNPSRVGGAYGYVDMGGAIVYVAGVGPAGVAAAVVMIGDFNKERPEDALKVGFEPVDLPAHREQNNGRADRDALGATSDDQPALITPPPW